MKTVLGLDLGTNSIGWALILLDENDSPIKIIAMGSRIIPLDANSRDQFAKGQAISKNKDRTTARTQRKGYDRKQLRKKDIKKLLNDLNILPTDELMNMPMLDLWKLRNDAVNKNENITAEQLGRILYMLNQKRGYKSARSEANADKKDTDYVAAVKGRYAQLKENNQTIGQHFYTGLNNANIHNQYFKVKENVYPREAYIEEFDNIMNVQKSKHAFLTEEVIETLKNEIIYYQRKLKSQKGLVNVCEFEGFEKKYLDKETQKEKTAFVGPKVAPKTSPLYQLCKIWENVNNINVKTKNPEGSKYKWSDYYPTIEEKEKIAAHLNTNAKLTYDDLLKILNLKKEEVFANKQLRNGLQGNITYSEIEKIIGKSNLLQIEIDILATNTSAYLYDKKTGEIIDEKDGFVIDAKVEKEPLYQLWHTIYSIQDLEECKNALIKRFAIDAEIAEKLSKIDFNKQAFGNKSNKAIRKILPYLMQGFDYSQACSFAGYNHSNSLTKDENEKRILKEKLELIPKNGLRQPVVEKILNQMINMVNAIIENYGKPTEIRVELARELKQSKDERENADKYNRDAKKLNEDVEKRLKSLGISSTKKFVQKYKYIFQTRGEIDAKGKLQAYKVENAKVTNQCIYCGQSFDITEAITGDNFDVDHIIPKALLFDDSQTNKVLVHRSCNKNKTNTTAYDYLVSKGEEALNQYIQRVDEWYKSGIIGYGKMQRLKVSYIEYTERKKRKKETEADKKLWEEFIDRQKRETAYISRKAVEILQQICTYVYTTEGSVTAKLRKLWGWEDALMNLQLPKYKELGQTEIKEWESDHGKNKHQKEVVSNWTKRDDHRHHAIDALVIACTKQGFIQRMNTLNAEETKDAMNKEIEAAKKKFGKQYDENILKENNEIVKLHEQRKTTLDRYLESQRPELFTTKFVEQEADKILVSFKAGKKVATKGVRKIKKDGNKIIVQNVLVPRGALHEQSVNGKIKVVDKNKNLKYLFENVDTIIDKKIQQLIKNKLAEYENDTPKAIASLKKNPIYINEEKKVVLEKANCYIEESVLKYEIQKITTKDVPYIVDEKVKQLVKERLEQYNGKEKEAFKNILWFNEAKQIPIKTVRLFTKLKAVEAIKKDTHGKEIGFAVLGNNHHIAIYKDADNNYSQHACTLWHALERKKNNLPVIINNTTEVWNTIGVREMPQPFLEKLPNDNLTLEYSLQQNEMYILGMRKEDVEIAINTNDKKTLSKHLYLVWSVGDNQYWFRHHLETKNSDLKKTEGAKESKRYYLFKSVGAFLNTNPLKVRINNIGEISKIGE
jgi:CRISPR-associated endonuclease Csn1